MGYTNDDLKMFPFFQNKEISSVIDYLTEVVNRECTIYFIKSLITSKTPFSLYFLDIDNFKIINDECGHQIGDIVLQEITSILIENTKEKGLVGRFGGDEFIIVSLQTTDYDSTWQFSKKIFTEIRNTKIDILNDDNVSITMGVVAYPKDALTYEELFLKADKALYRGKQKGRNCFIIYDEEKHKDIDISSKPEQLSNIVNHIYQLLMEDLPKEDRLVNACSYLTSIFNLSFYYVNLSGTVTTLSTTRNENLNKINLDSFIPVFNDKDSFALNDYSKLKDNYKEFHEYCWNNRIQSLICEKVFAGKKIYGYLLVVDHKVKRIWQKDDKILFSFYSKLIGLINHYKL